MNLVPGLYTEAAPALFLHLVLVDQHVGDAVGDGEFASSLWAQQLPLFDLHLKWETAMEQEWRASQAMMRGPHHSMGCPRYSVVLL